MFTMDSYGHIRLNTHNHSFHLCTEFKRLALLAVTLSTLNYLTCSESLHLLWKHLDISHDQTNVLLARPTLILAGGSLDPMLWGLHNYL